MLPFTLLGIAGILGWGALVSKAWTEKAAVRPSADLSIVQGIIVVALLRLLTSSAGWVHSSLSVSIAGSALLVLLRPTLHFPNFRTQRAAACAYLFVVIFTLVMTASVYSYPIAPGDSTYVWTYRAKSFTCEPIFQSDLMRERFWTWAHPEYPILQPMLHSFFFALHKSFRDDMVLIWQALLVLGTMMLIQRKVGEKATPWSGALLALATLFLFHKYMRGEVELTVGMFTAVTAIAVIVNSQKLLPIGMLGMAMTKNEAAVSALIGIGCIALALPKFRNRNLGLSALLVVLAIAFTQLLPSFHETYPHFIFSAQAWREGFDRLSTILPGMAVVPFGFPMYYFALQVVAVLILYRLRIGAMGWSMLAWLFVLQLAFVAIYMITPWGKDLHRITYSRLYVQSLAPVFLATGYLLIQHGVRTRQITCALWVIAMINPMILNRWREGEIPRPRAATLGRLLPGAIPHMDARVPAKSAAVKGKVALLGDRDIFEVYLLNYFLYPRKFYAQAPDVVFGTWRPMANWTEIPQQYRDTFDVLIGPN